jgi:diguanylate cyclase (GGDEF)-like protein
MRQPKVVGDSAVELVPIGERDELRPDEIDVDIRQRTARRQQQSAQARLLTAGRRDVVAADRDLSALARNRAADARDIAMTDRDAIRTVAAASRTVTGAEIVERAADRRKHATDLRSEAAEQRGWAARDRRDAARDSEAAARERALALLDRVAFAELLASAETDTLTGARTRAAGLMELDNELDRCSRSNGLLIVAYVDVVGLKAVNDAEGHAAGDDLLARVVALIRGHLRSYDLVVRIGGDEFLFVMSSMTLADARRRFTASVGALAAAHPPAAITVGFAELSPGEAAAELIERADRELIAGRRADRDSRPQPASGPSRSEGADDA